MREWICSVMEPLNKEWKFIAKQELVRCKDCKWFLSDNICGNNRLSDQEDIATLGPDWFCADGRKRDG